jgi:hypothetical protein
MNTIFNLSITNFVFTVKRGKEAYGAFPFFIHQGIGYITV